MNRIGWDALGAATRPLVGDQDMSAARERLDACEWLPWAELQSVLCLAGGGGLQGPLFASLGYRVTVADLSSAQLGHDREIASARGLELECVEADMLDLHALHDRDYDLVYQPISTCYVPDLSRLYREVAHVLRPGGLYLVEHWLAGQIQLGEPRWDGSAYRIEKPLVTGEPVVWHSPTPIAGAVVACWHYRHPLGSLLGDLCRAGFVIEQACEPVTGTVSSPPGSEEHLAAYVRPFLRLLARRGGS